MGIIHRLISILKIRKHKAFAVLACLVLFLGLDSFYLVKNQKKTFITAKFENVDHIIEVPGDIEAQISVAIKSRIEGRIRNIFFNESQAIKAGDLLYEIDSTKYLENLNRAKEQLALDQKIADQSEREASIKIDLANIEFAQLQLQYCNIISPIDGIAGKSNVEIGDEVKTETGQLLTNIYKTAPVIAKIYMPREYVDEVLRSYKNKELEIVVKDDDGKEIKDASIAELLSEVMIVTFPNQNQALWPNKAINVELKLYTLKNAIIVPSVAVWRKDDKDFVWILDSKGKTQRQVYVGFERGDSTIIKRGVNQGEKIAIEKMDIAK